MQEITNVPKRFRQIVRLPPNIPLITPKATSSAEYKPPNNPRAKVLHSPPSEPLTAEQELLMIEHLPIVRFIARRIQERLPRHVSVEDLYSAGVLGLLDACSRFDHSKQVQFRTYAQFRIRGAILDSLRTLDWSPRELRHKGRAVEQAIQTLTAQFHRSPTDTEIAQKLNIPLLAYQQLLGELRGLEIGTLHSERSADSEEEELICVPGRAKDDPLFCYLDAERRQRLTKAISDLPERERLVITLYYYEELTMKEIGIILGVVESRVCQINAATLLHLRARLSAPANTEESRQEETRPERVRKRRARRRTEGFIPPGLRKGERNTGKPNSRLIQSLQGRQSASVHLGLTMLRVQNVSKVERRGSRTEIRTVDGSSRARKSPNRRRPSNHHQRVLRSVCLIPAVQRVNTAYL